jgi:membrane protein required for colicin V production
MEPVPTQGLSLNIFDIIVVALIGYGMFRGYKKGMIKSVAGIIGIILSIIFAINFSTYVKDWLAARMAIDPMFINILSFVLIALVVMVVVTFVFNFIEDLLGKMNLGIENALGAVAGGYLAALGLSILLNVLKPINIPSPTSVSDSITYQPVKSFAVQNLKMALGILPLAKEALQKVDKLVKDDSAKQQPAPAPVQQAPKPTPVR